ncbi:hypothetical protein PG1629B_0137 [Bifidobacterium pseudolongum subsp. pseudolongum]|nr:hypothetical protein PG1629B_0137 [Bifidobacterium pseudolongum subsp. pseudolongum]
MPLTTKLPYFAMSLTGMIARHAHANASARPHSSPGSGNDSAPKSPPVASSHTPVNASATPTTSRALGRRRPRTHTYPSTISRFTVCSTVAVPAFVQWIENRYATCTSVTQVSAVTRYIG